MGVSAESLSERPKPVNFTRHWNLCIDPWQGRREFGDTRVPGTPYLTLDGATLFCLSRNGKNKAARISYNLERRFSHVQENSESLQRPEKVAILRLHLLEHTPVSDLCDQHGIHPTMFYRWQKEFFENAAAAFEHRSRRPSDDKDRRIALLEQKLQRKHEVLSELMEEHIKLKKELGEL